MEEFDVVVIGAGPGGYPAAIRAAQLGARTAIVERGSPGGTCLNWGCIPSKTLIAAAELHARLKAAPELGIRVAGLSFDYGAMVRRKDEVVGKLAAGVRQLLEANGVASFKGTGSFEARNRIAVASASGTKVIGAGRTILATGSTSAMPSFLPRHERVVESRGFLDRRSLPGSAIVLGGGIIGCEFAGMLANLGVRVTVVELLEEILSVVDPDVRAVVRRHMEKSLGVRVLAGKPLEKVAADDRSVRGECGEEPLEAELLLVAAGRKPVTDGLRLENAGLKTTERGTLAVDEVGRTAAPTVYAIGDLTDGPQLAHAATSQGIVAAEHACGRRLRKRETVIPSCIFTSPEIGTAGLGEEEAARRGLRVRVGKFPFSALGKALAAVETIGFAKWIADAETDQLLGAQVVGAHATELVAEAASAIRAELTAGEIGRTIHAHPTLSEAWMEAAHAVHGDSIHAAPRRKRESSAAPPLAKS
jgi:dihydrolipoamide dehydrogenase